jgi:uncharacterized protein
MNKNIEIVKYLYEAFSRKDIQAILNMLSEEVEWVEPENPYNPCGGTRKGHAGFLEWAMIGRDVEEILVLQPKQFLINEDSVAVIGYMECLAKPTGKKYTSDFVHYVVIKDNKIKKFQEFFDTFLAGEAFIL